LERPSQSRQCEADQKRCKSNGVKAMKGICKHWISPAKERKAATAAAFLVRRVVTSGSGTRAEALVGLDVVVAALLADPVADQVLGAIEFLRPGVARHQILGLVDDAELAIALDLADEHRLGDVVVREHLRDAASQVRRFDARQ